MKQLVLLLSIVIISSAFVYHSAEGKTEKFVVIIDAGHGGKDPGNETDSLSEAQINLQLADQILEIKKKKRKNIEFIFTRKGDDFIELQDRIALIDKHNADLFISIHCDAYTDESIQGYEIYHPIKGDQIVGSKNYAHLLEEALEDKKNPMAHKSTKPGNQFVITRAHCPAVLINFGFLTNPKDLKTVTTEEYQLIFAEAIVKSIHKYRESIEEPK